MNLPQEIDRLVSEGAALYAALESGAQRMKEISAALSAYALAHGEQVLLEDEEREGRQVLLCGSSATVPVVVSSDLLVLSFQKNSAQHERVQAALTALDKHEVLPAFYKLKPSYEATQKDGKKFRRLATEKLGPEGASVFLSACRALDKDGMPKSRVFPAWDRVVNAEVRDDLLCPRTLPKK